MKIFCQNVTSLKEKRRMIEVGENIKQEGAAVALLQETRLEDKRKLIGKGMIAFKSSE